MIDVVLVPADGGLPTPRSLDASDVEAFQALVGGFLETVRVVGWPPPPAPVLMLVNEDGRRLGLPPNLLASSMTGRPIVGDAVLIGDDGTSSFAGVPPELLVTIRSLSGG